MQMAVKFGPRKHYSWIALFLFALVASLQAQNSGQEPPAPSIRVTTHYVVVDVVVTDKSGNPVTNLKPEDFTVEENGKKQQIANFAFQQPARNASPPALPPNVYSNRPEYNAPQGPLDIVLLDALNTRVANQAYAKRALLSYLTTQFEPGQRMAVYGLTTHLVKLQDFTSDPELLRQAILNFGVHDLAATAKAEPNPVQTSVLTTNRAGTGLSSAGLLALHNLQMFEIEQSTAQLEASMADTVEALKDIASATTGYPGRKNLIWVSAGFPFNFMPEDITATIVSPRIDDPTAPPPTANEAYVSPAGQIMNQFNEEIRKLGTLLSSSQIAVYPVDARGLVGATLADASKSGLNSAGLLQMGHEYGSTVRHSTENLTASIETMRDIAQQTGGRAFVNRNDIDHAVAIASTDGTSSYTLGYYSQNKKYDSGFRKIKVQVSHPDVTVRHRNGYYAIDLAKQKNSKEQEASMANAIRDTAVQASMVMFSARVVPPPAAAQASVPVQFLVDPKSFNTEDTSDNHKKISLDFYAVAFSPDGKMVKNAGTKVETALDADQYSQVQQRGLLVPVSIALAPGDYQLRLAVRDNKTGYIGTLGVPLSLKQP